MTARSAGPLLDDLVADHTRSLLGSHLIDVVSTDRHTVKPWFAGRTDVSPVVADFADHGYRLVGGRADYLDHQRAAVVVYQHGAHVINVFSWALRSAARAARHHPQRLSPAVLEGRQRRLLRGVGCRLERSAGPRATAAGSRARRDKTGNKSPPAAVLSPEPSRRPNMTDDHRHLSRRTALNCMAYGGAGTLFTLSGGVAHADRPGRRRETASRRSPQRQTAVRADQRYPHRLRQGGQSGRRRHADAGHRSGERHAGAAGAHHPHRRHHPPVQGRRSSTARSSCSRSCESPRLHTTPGEHDVADATVSEYFSALRQGLAEPGLLQLRSCGRALHRADQRAEFKAGRLGNAGRRSSSPGWRPICKGAPRARPIVVFAHMPLWTIYEPWGWGTGDADQLMSSCSGSARSPCSTDTFTRSCRRSRATSPSIRPARPPIRSPSPATAPGPGRSRCRPISCPECSEFPSVSILQAPAVSWR